MAKNKSFNVGENINFAGMLGLGQPAQSDISKENNTIKPDELNKDLVSVAEPVKTTPTDSLLQEAPKVMNPTKVTSVSENTEFTAPIRLNKKNKKTRSVHKNFLLTEELADKLASVASKLDVSQNDVINEILEQVFSNMII